MKDKFLISNDWLILFAYLVAIFTVLPFSLHIAQKLIEMGPFFSLLVSLSVYAAIGIVTIALVIYVKITDKEFKIPRLLALAVILLIGLSGLMDIKDPHDKLHLVEYSILAFLLFRVLRFYNPTTALYLWCVIFVGTAGFADECVQSFMPGRNFSLRDVGIDIFAAILSELSIALVVCPKLEKWRIKMSFFKKKLYDRQKWVEDYRRKRTG